jgi:hypothetical protein
MNEYDSQTVRIVTRSRPPSEAMDEAAAQADRLRLTDAEREAIEVASAYMGKLGNRNTSVQETLRGLLERLG